MGIGNSCQDSLHKKLILVGGFNPSEKYEFVSWDDSSQYMGKTKMFQTTNQLYSDFGKHKTENSSR
jgi:hypothetical protein